MTTTTRSHSTTIDSAPVVARLIRRASMRSSATSVTARQRHRLHRISIRRDNSNRRQRRSSMQGRTSSKQRRQRRPLTDKLSRRLHCSRISLNTRHAVDDDTLQLILTRRRHRHRRRRRHRTRVTTSQIDRRDRHVDIADDTSVARCCRDGHDVTLTTSRLTACRLHLMATTTLISSSSQCSHCHSLAVAQQFSRSFTVSTLRLKSIRRCHVDVRLLLCRRTCRATRVRGLSLPKHAILVVDTS